MIRLPDCKLLAQGHHRFLDNCPCGSTVTSISHHFGSVAQSEEQPVVCGKAEGASPFGSANFKSYREADSQGFGFAFLHSDVSKSRPEFSARSVAATHSAWDRGIAGATPAALTNFIMLPWSNTSGIRLLNGTMQVRVLPAAPLPDSVKVARRPVKPGGVGASPTLAANLEGRQI